jgi:DNA-binding transcriptional MerR regulator
MEDKNTEKRYRIGDFARFMGVSPDFLKLYEEAGLLRVEQRRSGYRYYPFHDSARVLEYMKLRNYGVRIRDMEALLLDEEDNVLGELDRKADEMRRSVERTEILIDAHDRFRRWAEARRRRPIDWEIKELEPAFFLFHSNSQDFIDDDRIYEIVRDWSSWLPAVKSAMYVRALFLLKTLPRAAIRLSLRFAASGSRRPATGFSSASCSLRACTEKSSATTAASSFRSPIKFRRIQKDRRFPAGAGEAAVNSFQGARSPAARARE